MRNATIEPGTGVPAFVGDIGIVVSRFVRRSEDAREQDVVARIEDLGDLRVYGALNVVDATGLTLAPLFARDARVGDTVELPDPPSDQRGATIAVGQPGDVLLLRPAGGRRYTVERVIRFGR